MFFTVYIEKCRHVCTTSDVTSCFHSSPDTGTKNSQIAEPCSLKNRIWRIAGRNDVQRTLNYKISTISENIFKRFINTFIIFILKSMVFTAIWLVHRIAISARIALLAVRFVLKSHLLSTNHISQPIIFNHRIQTANEF
jgi:hypothetical protein